MAVDDPRRSAVQRYCTSIARDSLLVQAAGGNVSWKDGHTLWIKASGMWLADAERTEIFLPVDRRPIDAALAQGDYSISPMALEGYSLRPSIETLLHALMPHKYVVHLHPVVVVAHLVRMNCRADLQTALGEVFNWELLPYYKPGAELAQAVHTLLRERTEVQVVLLEKHGLIIGAETIEEIEQLLQTFCRCLNIHSRPLDKSIKHTPKLFLVALEDKAYQPCLDATLHCLATDPYLYEQLGNNWAICPDHVVFLGARAIRIDDPSVLCCELKSDPNPPFIFIKGVGVLENRAATLAQKKQLIFYRDVIARQPVGQLLSPLSTAEVASLLNWDAEKYRLTINQSTT